MPVTREQLIDEIRARLDERLSVEDPLPYGPGIVVTGNEDEATLVAQPGGPHFLVEVREVLL